MSKYLVIWIGILSFQYIQAQSFGNNVAFFDDEIKETIECDGFGAYGSNVMDVETMKLFYRGGLFDNDLKGESLNRLSAKNLFGGEYGMRLAYQNPNVKWLDSAGVYAVYELGGGGGIGFTQDLFSLVFEGNQQFAGDSALLSGTEFSSFAYKKIGFGYNKANRFKVGLSLMSFDNYSYGMIDRGTYYADANSDSLHLMLSGNWMTDNGQTHNSPVGYGIGVDFEMNLPYEDIDSLDIPRMVFGVRNLGLFFSTKQMNVLAMDTLYSYAGFEVNNLTDFQSSLFPEAGVQDSLLPNMTTDRVFRFLPFELYFYSTSSPQGKKMQLVYGMRYRFGVAMVPQIYIGGDWRPTENMIITPFFNFGGYSYVKTGLSIQKQMGKLKMGIVANNVPGFFTREAYQQSLGISLSYGIK